MFKAILALVLLWHAAVTTFVVQREGLASLFPPFPTWSHYQIFNDLGIALGLFACWMVLDVKQRGRPWWEAALCIVGIALLGSFSPLIYLLLRPSARYTVTAPG